MHNFKIYMITFLLGFLVIILSCGNETTTGPAKVVKEYTIAMYIKADPIACDYLDEPARTRCKKAVESNSHDLFNDIKRGLKFDLSELKYTTIESSKERAKVSVRGNVYVIVPQSGKESETIDEVYELIKDDGRWIVKSGPGI